MFQSLSNYISEIIRGKKIRLAGKEAQWKKVNELKVGAKIAITDKDRVTFDEIVSIKKVGQKQVYDIEVEGSHNFVGNGILAHNTYIMSGNLGIGTTSPSSLLDIASTAPTLRMTDTTASAKSLLLTTDGNLAQFEEAGGAANDLFVLDLANARVGIGTTAPGASYLLEVNGALQADDYYSGDGTQGATSTVSGLVFKDGLYTSGSITDFDNYVSWTIADDDADTYAIVSGNILRFSSTDGNVLTNLTNGDDGDENLDLTINLAKDLVAGDGLTGGADNILVGADSDVTVSLNTPGTLTVSTTNSSTGNHTHAITSSTSPAGTASLLSSAADGGLQLLRIGLGADPDTDNRLTVVDGGTIGQTSGMLLTFDDSNNDLGITGGSVGVGTTAPSSLLELSSTAPTLRMTDTTASAKSLLLTTDGNLAQFEEAGGAANDLFVLDLANARVGIGTTAPGASYLLEVNGALQADDYYSGDGTQGATSTVSGLVFKDGLYTSGSITDFDNYVSWTIADDDADTYAIVSGNILRFSSTDGNVLTNLTNGDDGDENLDLTINLAKDLVAGDGLTGGADNILVGADSDVTVSLNTPGTLTVSTTNSSTGNHTHAITSSTSPAGTASLLSSAADGGLQLLRIGLGADPDTDNRLTVVDGGTIGQTSGMLLTFDDSNNDLGITGGSVGVGTTAPSSLLELSSTAPTLRMTDTTASAKSLLLTTDGNLAQFEEAGGAANDLFVLDLANARVGIGTTAPGASYLLEVNGALQADDYYSGDGTQGATSTVSGLVFKDGLYTSGSITDFDNYVSWTIADDDADTYAIVSGNILRFSSTDGNVLTNLTNGDDGDENLDLTINLAKDLVAGDGLTGGADNILVGADSDVTVSLNTPGTLTVSTTNSSTGNHTHAITSSTSPAGTASLLSSAADGGLQLLRIGLGADPDTDNRLTVVDGGTIGQTSGMLLTFDDSNNDLGITGGSVGVGTTAPSSLLELSSTAPTLRMTDTTASAKSLLLTTDGNLAQFEEAGGAANDLFVLDLANARVGIGTTAPGASYLLEVNGALQADDYYSGDGTQGATSTVSGLVFKDGLYTSGSITDFDNYVSWTIADDDADTYAIVSGNILRFSSTDGNVLTNLTNGDDGDENLDLTINLAKDLVAGDGLTGGADNILVGADSDVTVSLNTPGTLTVSTTNSSTGNHTHAITSSTSPAGTASLLSSAADGGLQLLRIGLGADPDTDNRLTVVDGGTIGQTSGMLLTFDDSNNDLGITGGSVGVGTTAPSSLLELSSTAPTLRMTDTTASAKSLLLTTDGNLAQFEEVGGAANDLFVLDLANARVGIGTTAPGASYLLEVNGALQADDYYSGDGTQGATSTVSGLVFKDGLYTSGSITDFDNYVSWTIADDDADTYAIVSGNILRFSSTDGNVLTNLTNGDDGDENLDLTINLAKDLVAGDGLTGGADNILVGADSDVTVSLNTPGTLTVSTTNSSTGNHTHAITSSTSPAGTASLLSSAADGGLQLLRIGLGADPDTDNRLTVVDGGTIGQTSGMLLTFDDSNNDLGITGGSVGVGTTAPSSLLELSSTAPTLRMTDTTASAKSLLLTTDGNLAQFEEAGG